MKKLVTKESIKVETFNHQVDRWYFEFDYKLYRKGKLIRTGNYNSSHERSVQFMKKALKSGYATELVMELL